MSINFEKYLLDLTSSSNCIEIEIIQTLWSGYGKITRFKLENSVLDTVVVKNISLDLAIDHPRGWNTNNSHNRKVKSYQIETHWYQKWNQDCNENCRTPKFLGSFSEGENQWIVLEDLNPKFPLRKYELKKSEIKACLKWLANFHIIFLMKKPKGLWKEGTYWHLATRPDELEKIENQELKINANKIDSILNNCKYLTFVHGDAKLANFCFSENGNEIAAVDFQYVGGGCGMKDVAYFLGSCLLSSELEAFETELLDTYFFELKEAFKPKLFNFTFEELETEWRKMYPFACTDFTRFLLGWMPSHQKINDYNLKLMKSVLSKL